MIRFNTTKSKKKKPDKILLLAKSKLNIIETLVSQALVDMEICHEEFITILNEKDEHEMNEWKSMEHKWEIWRKNEIKQCEFKILKTRWLIYTSSDFSWYKNM